MVIIYSMVQHSTAEAFLFWMFGGGRLCVTFKVSSLPSTNVMDPQRDECAVSSCVYDCFSFIPIWNMTTLMTLPEVSIGWLYFLA